MAGSPVRDPRPHQQWRQCVIEASFTAPATNTRILPAWDKVAKSWFTDEGKLGNTKQRIGICVHGGCSRQSKRI